MNMPPKQSRLLDDKLPTLARYITDHDPTGLAIFSDKFDEILPRQEPADEARLSPTQTSHTTPVDLAADKDLIDDQNDSKIKAGGTKLRVVDMRPGATFSMHKIVNLDYGVVIEGEVELSSDSGEVRLMRRGDLAVQRGADHAWRNASTTTWARMMYVLQEAKPGTVGEKRRAENWGDIPGVRPSKRSASENRSGQFVHHVF